MKRAFTLIELLVVIGILALLIGVMIPTFGKSTESARRTKCAANMRNLCVAIRSTSASAQSYQYAALNTEVNEQGLRYNVHKGWISYLDQGTKYPLESPGTFSQPSFAGTEEETIHALTNGAIWTAIRGNRDSYLCPEFVNLCRKNGLKNPGWSYQMSAYFGYEPTPGEATTENGGSFTSSRADRILLLAEIPARELTASEAAAADAASMPTVKFDGAAGDPAMDGCLLYQTKGGNESIGFNHYQDKKLVGHVAFADGHIETITAPAAGNYIELTDWLCRGCDIVYRDGTYQEVDDSDVQ